MLHVTLRRNVLFRLYQPYFRSAVCFARRTEIGLKFLGIKDRNTRAKVLKGLERLLRNFANEQANFDRVKLLSDIKPDVRRLLKACAIVIGSTTAAANSFAGRLQNSKGAHSYASSIWCICLWKAM